MERPTWGNRLFLIGSDATQAMSPRLWNPVLERLGSRWRYEGWDIPAGADMSGVRDRLLADDVVAANVTMPHKTWAARSADIVSEPVRLSGASNLLIGQGTDLHAHNTDVTAVEELAGRGHHRHVVMLGAGGAARAALVALRDRVSRVTVADRDAVAAADLVALAGALDIAAEQVPWDDAQAHARHSSLIVNATPIGKRADDDPVWGMGELASDAVVYDFVYAGHVTATISAARGQGLRCVDGWVHLQAQAAAMVPLLGLAPAAGALLAEELRGIRAGS